MAQPRLERIARVAEELTEAAPFSFDDFNQTDSGNAELLAHLFADALRFDHRSGKWLVWREHWWEADPSEEIRLYALIAARARAMLWRRGLFDDPDDANKAFRFCMGSENNNRLSSMVKLARSRDPLSVPATERWNDNPWLVGVNNGVVNLRNGELLAGRREDRVTKHVEVDYDPDAKCPRFLDFLAEVFDNDLELVNFILRAIGYSLSGDTREQVLFFCHGAGANGKSVFLDVLRSLAGPFAENTGFSTFEYRDRSSIGNELAALDGARVVTASETSDTSRLNESRIKALTGSDPITARFLYGEPFTFVPCFKLWLASNHKPRVRDDSYGFWRRVLMIPFNVQFGVPGGPARDPRILDKLLAELPGIFRLAVESCKTWQGMGLAPPESVSSATEDYRIESDPLTDFVLQVCQHVEGASVRSSEAHRAYRRWAESEGMTEREVLGSKTFSQRFKTHFAKGRTEQGSVFLGVALRDGPVHGREADAEQAAMFGA